MPASYDGFSQHEKVQMERAFNMMKSASAKASKALLGGDLTAYRKWFEAGDNKHLMKVATTVKAIDQAINSRPITFAKLDRPGMRVDTTDLCAYVWLVKSGQSRVHVGSGMRILVVWKTHANNTFGYLAQTMYHELSHKVASTFDHAYKEQLCKNFCSSAPQTAVTNAENFNLFLREYL